MSPKPFQPVCLDARPKAPRGRPPKSTKRQPIRYTKTVPKAQVSQFTRDRLYNQALSHPAYEGMPPDDVRRYIDSKIDSYIASYPWCFGHLKKDRLFEIIERLKLPTVFFAEGGGGRPGDTDHPTVSSLEVRAFALWASLSGVVPRIAVVKGRCFAGNAVIAGCSDLIVATEDTSLGMGGPAMIAGGGLGEVAPDEVGPISMQAPNGVVDVVVPDEAAAVTVTKQLLGYFDNPGTPGAAGDQNALRTMVPERARRAYPIGPIITTLADANSVTFLRERFAPEMVTALARIDGRPVGVIANNTMVMAGAITAAAADKAARFLQLCDTFGIAIVSLIDCPGYMVGPAAESQALVRRASRMLVAGAALRVPLVAVVLRRGYGLGAQAMAMGRMLSRAAWTSSTDSIT